MCTDWRYGKRMTTEQIQTAQPRPGSVTDKWGNPVASWSFAHQSRFARCENCGLQICALDRSADWMHIGTEQGRCGDIVGELQETARRLVESDEA